MDAVSSSDLAPRARSFAWRVTPLGLVIGLAALTLVLRVWGMSSRPLWLDEAYSAWFSSRSWHVLWSEVPAYEPHPPFYYSLLKLWREFFGGTPLGLRSFSLLFAVCTIPIVVAASNELERQRPSGRPLLRAGMAACLTAVSPMLVMLGSEARPYPLLIFAYSLALLAILRLMREFESGGAGRVPSWSMLVSGTELGLWAHGLGLFYALCIAAALAPAWLKSPTRPRIVHGVAAGAGVALLYLPCALMIARRAGDWGGGWLSWEPAMTLQLLTLYTVPVEVLTVSSAVAALVMVLLAKRALQNAFQRRGWDADRAILLLWWGPPLIAILVSQLAFPIFLPRTLTPTLIPAYLALAGALARIDNRRERFALSAALAITLLPAGVQIAARPSNEAWDEVAAYLRQHVRPGDEVWVYPNDSALPLRETGLKLALRGVPGEYPAMSFAGPVRAGSPAVKSLTADQARTLVGDPRNRRIATIWLVTRQSGIFDPHNDLPNALARVRQPGVGQRWGTVEVRPFSANSVVS